MTCYQNIRKSNTRCLGLFHTLFWYIFILCFNFFEERIFWNPYFCTVSSLKKMCKKLAIWVKCIRYRLKKDQSSSTTVALYAFVNRVVLGKKWEVFHVRLRKYGALENLWEKRKLHKKSGFAIVHIKRQLSLNDRQSCWRSRLYSMCAMVHYSLWNDVFTIHFEGEKKSTLKLKKGTAVRKMFLQKNDRHSSHLLRRCKPVLRKNRTLIAQARGAGSRKTILYPKINVRRKSSLDPHWEKGAPPSSNN